MRLSENLTARLSGSLPELTYDMYLSEANVLDQSESAQGEYNCRRPRVHSRARLNSLNIGEAKRVAQLVATKMY